MLARTIETLRDAGVSPITLVGTEEIAQRTGVLPGDAEICLVSNSEDALRLAATKMADHFAGGAGTVLVQKMGAYIEFNLADMLKFHEEQGSSICRAADSGDHWTCGLSMKRRRVGRARALIGPDIRFTGIAVATT